MVEASTWSSAASRQRTEECTAARPNWTEKSSSQHLSSKSWVSWSRHSCGTFQLVLVMRAVYCAANAFDQVTCEFHLSEPISFNRENENQTVEVGTRRFILKCDVKGNPRPRVTWNLRGQVVRDGNDEKYHPSDEGLVIYNVSESDGGTYKCKATQREGFITDFQDMVISLTVQRKLSP